MIRALTWGMLAVLASCPGRADAALPPHCYPDPKQAPEIVDIRVLSSSWLPRLLKSSPLLVTWRITAYARVNRVHTTAKGLAPGSVIRIAYDSEVPTLPICGGFAAYPFLMVGLQYKVHLSCSHGVYEPWGAPYNSLVSVSEEPEVEMAKQPAQADPGPIPWPVDWSVHLGQRVTVEGLAENHKIGAALHGVGVIYIDDLDSWPDGYYLGDERSKRVRVTGTVIERHDLPVFIPKEGEPVPQGMPVPEGTDLKEASHRFLIQNAKWAVVE